MVYKLFAICGAVFALSVSAFAAGNGNGTTNGKGNGNGKCVGKKCGGKEVGPTTNGDRPLVMEPQDTCKGTVKCVNQSRYPNGTKTEMTIDTPNGEQKVMMKDQGQVPVAPGDKVEVKGRNVEVNGDKYMMGESMQRTGTSNLNQNVQSDSSNQQQQAKKQRAAPRTW